MADPFEELRAPVSPVHPDASFAARLREDIERALGLPKGVTVSNRRLESVLDETAEEMVTRASEETTAHASAATGVLPRLNPYLAVSGAHQALSWYCEVLGARRRGEPYVMEDGSIGHAELEVGGSVLMLSEQSPSIGVVAPLPGEGVAVTLHLSVDDVDAQLSRALAAGATLERAAADYDYGRNAVFRDPFGHRWLVSAEPARAQHGAALRAGDVAYASLWVPDVGRAARFFAGVLGWRFSPGSEPHGRRVEGLSIHHGMWKGERSTLFLCFAVDDVGAGAERVRAAGGTAEEPHEEPYGLVSECADDQGVPFALFEIPPGASTDRRGLANGRLHGDLAYVTVEVVDSARARAFYGSVLGWQFAAGRVADGWQVLDTVPMIGLSGGHELATAVPMYKVDDIELALARVRSNGGMASDPEVQPYGTTSACADDQGTRFYLGQL